MLGVLENLKSSYGEIPETKPGIQDPLFFHAPFHTSSIAVGNMNSNRGLQKRSFQIIY